MSFNEPQGDANLTRSTTANTRSSLVLLDNTKDLNSNIDLKACNHISKIILNPCQYMLRSIKTVRHMLPIIYVYSLLKRINHMEEQISEFRHKMLENTRTGEIHHPKTEIITHKPHLWIILWCPVTPIPQTYQINRLQLHLLDCTSLSGLALMEGQR